MRVLVMPADLGGCGHYRLIMAAEYLRSLGHDIIINPPGGPDSGFQIAFDEDRNIINFKLPEDDVDVLVMQRASHEWHKQALPLMRRKGIAIVVDMDDDLSTIHPKNSAFWRYREHSKTPFSAKNAEFICREATLVTVSTKNLLGRYAKHGRGQVIDNYVPERYLYVTSREHRSEPTFGWAGTLQSHPTDVAVVGRAVRDLVDAGHQFRVVGPEDPGLREQFRLANDPWTTGVVSMFNWPTAIADTLDVGLAPLEPGTFNTSKSRLKLLEYASVGVPYVASPRAEYQRLHRESGGLGFLADTPKQWTQHTKELLTRDSLRMELSEKARAWAATQTIEQHAWRWLEAWERAMKIERNGGA